MWVGAADNTAIAAVSPLVTTAWITIFAALTAAGAQVEIPHAPVPFTLQTFFVILSGAFLGPRNGALSQLLYLAAGALGAPVFAGFSWGVACVFGPTGGYLLAFPLAAWIAGNLTGRKGNLASSVLAMLAGIAVIFIVGPLYLYAVFTHDARQALLNGLLIFSWWDALKIVAAAAIYNEFAKRYRRIP